MTQSWATPEATATVSNSWDTPVASTTVSNSWDTLAPSVPDSSWNIPVPTTQEHSWDMPAPTTQTSSLDAPSSRPMAPSVGRTRSRSRSRSHSRPSARSAQSFRADPAHPRSEAALDSQWSAPKPRTSRTLSAASNTSNISTAVSGASSKTPASLIAGSWDSPVKVVSKSWDISAASASWDAPLTVTQSQAHADRSASQSGDTPTIASAEMSWNTPAPAVANDSWDASTPALAADPSDRPAKQADYSWGAPDSSASELQHLSWDKPDGPPEGTSLRNPYGSGRHDSRPRRFGSIPNHESSDGNTSSAASKTAIGLGASRWAPTNRPQRRRFEGQRRRYEDEGDSRRGYSGRYSERDRSDNYGQDANGNWTNKDQGNIDTSGDKGAWPTPNARGDIDSDQPETAATTSNDWDAVPAATLTSDWEAVVVSPTTLSPVVTGNNMNLPDQQKDIKSVTPQAVRPPKPTSNTAAPASTDGWDATAPAVIDSWEAPTPAVNSWDAPALAVGYSRDAVSAPVREEAPARALPVPTQTESKAAPTRDDSWAAAAVFVPKSCSAPEKSSNNTVPAPVPAPAPARGTEYAGWDTPVPVPDNSWDATPTTASNGNTFTSSASPPISSKPMNALVPALHDPEPPQSERKFEYKPAIRAQDQSSQPSQSSWDTPALTTADNSWDMPTSASSWDATSVTTTQTSGWDAPNPADSRSLASDSWSQSQSQGYARNGSGAPKELHFGGGSLAGSKYSNGRRSYRGGSRGGRIGGDYDRGGGNVDDNSDYGGGYGDRSGYRGKSGDHQENDRPSARDGTHVGDGGPPRSIYGSSSESSERPSRDYDSNRAAQSWDGASAQQFSERRSWGSQVPGTAVSWNMAPGAAAESWDASAAAGGATEMSIASTAAAALPTAALPTAAPPAAPQGPTAAEAAGRTSPAPAPASAVLVPSTSNSWDASASEQRNDSWHIQQPTNSW
ncbi:hypothetical protein V1523DRAFT_412031 [Lipomyces doorenjongii]